MTTANQSQSTKKYFWLKRLLPRIQRKLLLSRAPVVAPYLRVQATCRENKVKLNKYMPDERNFTF